LDGSLQMERAGQNKFGPQLHEENEPGVRIELGFSQIAGPPGVDALTRVRRTDTVLGHSHGCDYHISKR